MLIFVLLDLRNNMSQNNLHTLGDNVYPAGGATPDYIPPDMMYGPQGVEGTTTTVTVSSGSTFPYKIVDVPAGAVAPFVSLNVTSALTGSEIEGTMTLLQGTGAASGNRTHLNRSYIIPNGVLVTKVGMSSTTACNVTFKMCRQESSTQYSIIDIGSFSHPGTGVYWYTLPTPFRVPSTGTWNPGICNSIYINGFWQSSYAGRNAAYKDGNLSGDSVTGFSATTNEYYCIGVKYQPQVYSIGNGGETEWQTLEAGTGNTGGGYTLINGSCALPAGGIVTQIGFYTAAVNNSCVAKICRSVSGSTFYPISLGTFNHPGTGFYWYTLPTPFRVPSWGTWYPGIYMASGGTNTQKAYTGRTAYYISGNITDTETSFSTYGTGYYCVSAKGYASASIMGAYDLGRIDSFCYSGPNKVTGADRWGIGWFCRRYSELSESRSVSSKGSLL
jgi:hypothetical protein